MIVSRDQPPFSSEIEIEIEIEMAVELPDELIVQILSFLPPKSLLRCHSVCKCWLNLISSTKFKLMHLHNSNQLNPRHFVRRLDYFDLRCCNGVVCLCDYDELNEYGFSLDTIILWNPLIRRKLTLPLPMFYTIGFEYPYVVLGFGYDKMSDDFKVVSLTYLECFPTLSRPKYYVLSQFEVYIVKTGIWREVMFPHNLCYSYIRSNWSQIFFNGCVHWIAFDSKWSHYSIMTFDITTELFGEFQLPEVLAQKHFLKVSVVGESLAVIHSSGMNFDGLKSTGSTYVYGNGFWALGETRPVSWRGNLNGVAAMAGNLDGNVEERRPHSLSSRHCNHSGFFGFVFICDPPSLSIYQGLGSVISDRFNLGLLQIMSEMKELIHLKIPLQAIDDTAMVADYKSVKSRAWFD
ncbi:hypothetical protein OSB04_013126 [Centaurea solstitialis]|uniref:F-box domain-containing protein n=1 Tax=Centaurea solstitialis TaxID=347529 RepID=A0AA38WF72_9ASTR|nr:hypothetical protein OSB04_013126 [Centaurea solstitialis]